MNDSINHNTINNIYISYLTKFCIKLEEFLLKKHLKALTEEVMYYKTNGFNGNDIEYSKQFCELYFINLEYLTNQINYILTEKFFYCPACSIRFDSKEELLDHQEYDCAENDLSDSD